MVCCQWNFARIHFCASHRGEIHPQLLCHNCCGWISPLRTSAVSCGFSHASLANLAFQPHKILLVRYFYTLLFTLSHVFIALSHAEFLSKLLVAAQFLGHETNPPLIQESVAVLDEISHVQTGFAHPCMRAVTAETFNCPCACTGICIPPTVMPLRDNGHTHACASLPSLLQYALNIEISCVQLPYFPVWSHMQYSKFPIWCRPMLFAPISNQD